MARAELREAAEAITDNHRNAADRVHDMRTSLKKARALIHLVRPAVGRRARRENHRLRAVADVVARFRDAEVVLKTFDVLVASLPESNRRRFGRTRSRLAATLAAEKRELLAAGQERDLRRRLRRRAKRVDRWAPRSGRWRVLGTGLVDDYRRAREAMARAYVTADASLFHDWRRAVKAHRHQMRALRSLAPATVRPRLAPLDQLGDLLGDEHDLTILADAVERARSCFSTVQDRDVLLRTLDQRQGQLRAEARPLGDLLFADRPSNFGRQVRAEMVGPQRSSPLRRNSRISFSRVAPRSRSVRSHSLR